MKRFRENKTFKWICVFETILLITFIYLYATETSLPTTKEFKDISNDIRSSFASSSYTHLNSIPTQSGYSVEREVSGLPSKLLFSKLFHNSMGDFELAPYFWRATSTYDRDMITITTMITEERIDRLEMLVNSYSGPISVTFHLPTAFPEAEKAFQRLESFYSSHPKVQAQVDLHVLRDNYSRQFNLWRNIARFFARTDYIFNIDADFKPSQQLNYLNHRDPSHIYIVPAFELASNISVPETKGDLQKLWKEGKATQFHAKFLAGHNATMYETWFKANSPYTVAHYHLSYEPYWIMQRDAPVWCDERFVGYGANKAACIFEMYSAGMPLIVLPNIFLVHMEHPYPESTRQMERLYNRRLYDHFRVELCMKYKRKSHPENIGNLLEDKHNCLIETARPPTKKSKTSVSTNRPKKQQKTSNSEYEDFTMKFPKYNSE